MACSWNYITHAPFIPSQAGANLIWRDPYCIVTPISPQHIWLCVVVQLQRVSDECRRRNAFSAARLGVPGPRVGDFTGGRVHRELPPGHRLYGFQVELVAAREGNDDVLFRHIDDPGRFTVIHLTWLGKEEIDAKHPWVEYDGDATGFVAWEWRKLG